MGYVVDCVIATLLRQCCVTCTAVYLSLTHRHPVFINLGDYMKLNRTVVVTSDAVFG